MSWHAPRAPKFGLPINQYTVCITHNELRRSMSEISNRQGTSITLSSSTILPELQTVNSVSRLIEFGSAFQSLGWKIATSRRILRRRRAEPSHPNAESPVAVLDLRLSNAQWQHCALFSVNQIESNQRSSSLKSFALKQAASFSDSFAPVLWLSKRIDTPLVCAPAVLAQQFGHLIHRTDCY